MYTFTCLIFIAEMASQQPKESVYQNDDFVSASIKADPRVKEYSVTFSDNGFILHADG